MAKKTLKTRTAEAISEAGAEVLGLSHALNVAGLFPWGLSGYNVEKESNAAAEYQKMPTRIMEHFYKAEKKIRIAYGLMKDDAKARCMKEVKP